MSRIEVCALSRIDEVASSTGARFMVTLINDSSMVQRPESIASERHLKLSMSDITAPLEGHVLPEESHVTQFLAFVRAWDRAQPLLIHCYAGVSRSTAGAYIAACALQPEACEQELAQSIRALSPTATPNARLVAVADDLLGRQGRMSAAIAAIGRGADCFEGVPFALALD
jgi:predicted protein tyrosine phosphatase